MTSPRRAELVARACALIEGWIGVTLTGAAPHRLHEFLERRARHLGLRSATAYIDHVAALSPDAPEVRRLVNLVTNGLTAFWRDEPQLDAVRLAIEQLAMRRDTTREPLSIWCAGCATGEEAYTLAMITRELALPAVVLGTDINTDFLAHAREGIYGSWSLRRLNLERRRAHFTQLDARHFEVAGALRRNLYFRQHNLLGQPPRALSARGWDVIVCRNVLIYFREEATRRVVDHFADALQPDGYLMLGSSEQLTSYFSDMQAPRFRATRHGAGFVYRLAATPPGATAYGLPLITERDLLSQIARQSTDLAEETVELDAEQAVLELLDNALDHLGRRDRETAQACFEAAAGYDPFVPETYYLMALMLRESAPGPAADALRKALFLNPYHWLAAFELAGLQERARETARARLSYRQALEGIAAGGALFEIEALAARYEPTATQRARVERLCEEALERLRRT